MHDRANQTWIIPEEGLIPTDKATLAVLMDIRAELRQVNRIIGCPNCTNIPHILEAIQKNK